MGNETKSATGSELVGQDKVIATVRRMVDAWRGFALGPAAAASPDEPPSYVPTAKDERAVSDTTMQLLQHWFRHEPHVLGRPGATYAFKYWPHQRRLVESFVYLYEVRSIRRTEQLYELCGVESLGQQRDPWAKLGGQLATGSGKTKMMSLLVAWSYLNAILEKDGPLGFGPHSILIAPGLFVRDRLLADFFPPRGGTSIFRADPVVPPMFDSTWSLKVYSPATCPMQLDPDEGALVVTNYHQLLRTSSDQPASTKLDWPQRSMSLLFEDGDPERLEEVSTPLVERLASSRGLLVLNDEAHHVGDEPAHAQFEQKAKEKTQLGDDVAADMAWIRSIRRLNGSGGDGGHIALQADLSATLFEETGSSARTTGTGKGAKARKEFKPTDLFRHTVVRYALPEAIRDEIVKRPVVERVAVKNKKTGTVEDLVRKGQPNAWETYRNILVTGIERWKKVRDQLIAEGDKRKPILFVLCNDRKEAREVANYLRHGEAASEDLARAPTGYPDPNGADRLFIEQGPDGATRSTVVEVHIGQKEESNEADWARIRDVVNQIDHDELPDPSGTLDDSGQPLMVPNPYNVVVSVMMLKEGWDVRNVKVIVPLRPCDSRTLTEQTLGRGLRKMHAPVLEDDGSARLEPEELYVIEHPSFRALVDEIDDLVEWKDSDEISHAREYVPIPLKADLKEREERGVRLVRFEGMIEVVPEWRQTFQVAALPALTPKLAWLEEIGDTEIHTYLKEALVGGEEDGQTFTLPAEPSYRDFDHILEAAFTVPLLRDIKASYQHKNAVKSVVKEFLERKTFALPAGIPLAFDRMLDDPLVGRLTLGNLARGEVLAAVRAALLPALNKAINQEKRASKAQISERTPERSYQALKKNVLEKTPTRSAFDGAAFDSKDELRLAVLLEQCSDVSGWLYNHRSGVGYSIEYDWQGYTAHYYPDFVVRARMGEVFHNFILEVKGRIDDRDKAKAQRGQRYCELLTEHDREPWHYLFVVENEPLGREDITWWQGRSTKTIGDLLRHHETLPLIPEASSRGGGTIQIVASISDEDQFVSALPVHDLAATAGGFSDTQSPEPIGWARVSLGRNLDRSMFLARIVGKSMEPGVPDGSWCAFRAYPVGEAPSATSLDGHRVVVQLSDVSDPDTGGQYTLKRWRVAKLSADGGVAEVELSPDNPSFKSRRLRPGDGEIRIVAELLEVVS